MLHCKKVAARRILICLRPISGSIPVAVSLGGENMLFLCGQSYKFLSFSSFQFTGKKNKIKDAASVRLTARTAVPTHSR